MAKIIYKGQTISGETTFNGLPDKPQINTHEVETGNNTSTGLEIMWHGTQAEYDALTTRNNECIYVIQSESTTPVVVNTTTNKEIKTTGGIDEVIGTDDITLKHTNSTTEQTTTSGGSYRGTELKWDAQGHITEGKDVVRTVYSGVLNGTLPNLTLNTGETTFALEKGVVVYARNMGYTSTSMNSGDVLTINVNGTGDKMVTWRYQAITSSMGGLNRYDTLELMYSGSNWDIIGGIKDEYVTATDTINGTPGLVPASSASENNLYLTSKDGWKEAFPPTTVGEEGQLWTSTGDGAEWGIKITSGTANPSGGTDGDIYLKYDA